MKCKALLLALVVMFNSATAFALSVGEMSVQSVLGEPLAISIDLSAQTQIELDSLRVQLAPRSVFEQISAPYPEDAGDIQFAIANSADGAATLKVSTANALQTPYLHLLLQLNWSSGSILREYVALIDPDSYQAGTAASSLPSPVALQQQAEGSSPSQRAADSIVTVVAGDSLSAIAERYRPDDVSVPQAWMAFYELNRDAFPANNIDQLQVGAQLIVPDREQMLAMTKQTAASGLKPLLPSKSSGQGASGSAGQIAGQKAEGAAEQTDEITRVEQAPARADELTIGGDSLSGANNGLDSATAERMLAGSGAEMARLRTDMFRVTEDMEAVRGENRVMTQRLSEVETQLSKLSQLLELQNKMLATLNEQARLQAQAIESAKSAPAQQPSTVAEAIQSSPAQSAPQVAVNTGQQPLDTAALQQEAQLAQQEVQPAQQQQAEQPAIAGEAAQQPIGSADLLPGEQPSQTASQSLDQALSQVETQDQAAQPSNQADQGSGVSPAPQPEQIPAPSEAPVAQGTQGAAPQAAQPAPVGAEVLTAEEQARKERIAALEARLRAKVAEARRKQALQAELTPSNGNGNGVADDDNWTGSVVSVKDKIVNTFNLGSDGSAQQDTAGSAAGGSAAGSIGLVGLLKKWGWYLLVAILGLLGLGALLRRRSDAQYQEMDDFDQNRTVTEVKEVRADRVEVRTQDNRQESSILDLNDDSLMQTDIPGEGLDEESSLFVVDDEDSMLGGGAGSDAVTQQSTVSQVMDVDPLAEAEVYLAYDRKEQAIRVLKDAYQDDPTDQEIGLKLLKLYREADDKRSFDQVLETAFAHRDQNPGGDHWLEMQAIGKAYSPGHLLFVDADDDFSSSMPVLLDEIEDEVDEVEDVEVAKSASLAAAAAAAAAAAVAHSNASSNANIMTEDEAASEPFSFEDDDSELVMTDAHAPEVEDKHDNDDRERELKLVQEHEHRQELDQERSEALAVREPESDIGSDRGDEMEGGSEYYKLSANDALILDDDKSKSAEDEDNLDDDEVGPAHHQHDPDTILALAKAYIDLGERDIAKDFLGDLIHEGDATQVAQAQALLKQV